MSTELITLLIIFWIPPLGVALSNILWDLRFWQNSEYRIDTMYDQLRWDFQTTHRRGYKTLIKIGLLMMVSMVLFFPSWEITLLGVLLMFTLWVSELFDVFEALVAKKAPELKWNARNLIIMIVGIGLLALPIIIVTLDLFLTPGSTLTGATSELGNIASSGGTTTTQQAFSLGVIAVEGILIIPSIYIYFVFSTLVGLGYDLGSPLITLLLVIITKPFAWIMEFLTISKARNLLRQHPKLVVVAVTGSYGKTTTKHLLHKILKNHYKVLSTPHTETTALGISQFLVDKLHHETDVLIVDINAYSLNSIERLSSLLKPHIAIMIGIDENHIGLFGSKEGTLHVKSQLLRHLRPGGTSILNIDDELIAEIAMQTNNKEILITSSKSPDFDTSTNLLEVDHYTISKQRVMKRNPAFQFTINRQQMDMNLTLPQIAKDHVHSIVAAIATATELGVEMGSIVAVVNEFSGYMPELELIDGDHDTTILLSNKKPNIRFFKSALEILAQRPKDTRVLVTAGIDNLGKHKKKVYQELAELIDTSTDVIITYDQTLADSLGPIRPGLQLVSSPNEILYQLRSRIEPGDTIMILGEIDPHVVAHLRSDS